MNKTEGQKSLASCDETRTCAFSLIFATILCRVLLLQLCVQLCTRGEEKKGTCRIAKHIRLLFLIVSLSNKYRDESSTAIDPYVLVYRT